MSETEMNLEDFPKCVRCGEPNTTEQAFGECKICYDCAEELANSKMEIENVYGKELVRMDAVEKAKRIKSILKKSFPQTKFSVRTERASMLRAVRIDWIDGPTTEQVKVYTDPYTPIEFDSFNHVSVDRRESTESYEWAKKQVEIITGQPYNENRNQELSWYTVWGKTDLTEVF